jgi:hypothetical protein
MRTASIPSATVLVLNASQTQQLARGNNSNGQEAGLSVINAGELADDELKALGLNTAASFSGPANRPDPVDFISISARELPVDRSSGNARPTLTFRGSEVDLVA